MAALKDLNKSKTIVLPDGLKEKLYRKKWVVYAKRPFAKPENSLPRPHGVIEYLGRYTHKSAISNYRIEKAGKGEVTFKYKVYKKGGTIESMSLKTMEFIRRFALHILPQGFARMRHYGLLSSKGQVVHLPVIQSEMNIHRPKKSKSEIRERALQRLKTDRVCPCCGHKNLRQTIPFPRGEPPDDIYILNIVLKL